MKKLTAGIFAAILTVVGTNAADAAIASKGYVDQRDAALTTAYTQAITNATSDKATKAELTERLAGKADAATSLAGYGITDAMTSTEITAAINKATEGIARDETVSKLGERVTTAEGKITTLEGTVGDATSGLVKSVADNTAAISTNAGKIAENTAAIAKHTEDVTKAMADAKTAADTAYAAAGTVNTLNTTVSGHATDIAGLKTADTTLQGNIDTLAGRVSTNETDIVALETKDGELQKAINGKAAQADLTAATTRISTLETSQSTQNEKIEALENATKDIATNTDVSELKTTVAEHTTAIATNEAATETNAAAIAANKTAVEKAQGDATAAGTAAAAAQTKADDNAEALAQLAWLANNPGECSKSGWKCALVIGANGVLSWEVIERGESDAEYATPGAAYTTVK